MDGFNQHTHPSLPPLLSDRQNVSSLVFTTTATATTAAAVAGTGAVRCQISLGSRSSSSPIRSKLCLRLIT